MAFGIYSGVMLKVGGLFTHDTESREVRYAVNILRLSGASKMIIHFMTLDMIHMIIISDDEELGVVSNSL